MVAAVERLDPARVRERYERELPALLARCADADPALDHDEAALVGWAWHQVDLRDEVLSALARGEPGVDALVRAVARLMPAPHDAPAAAMLGWLAYAEGSGVLAAAALERARASYPGYSLAVLLEDALNRQLPPSALRSVWARVPRRKPAR
jgi:hypothetical protein